MKLVSFSINQLVFILTLVTLTTSNFVFRTAAYAQDSDNNQKNIVQTIEADDELSTIESIIKTAKIEESLGFTDNITLLAPTNDAIAKIPEPIRTNLLKEENRDKLLKVLRYHVVLTDVEKNELDDNKELVTLLGTGSVIKLSEKDGKNFVNEKITAIALNESPKNGSIIKINEVLIPDGFDINSLNMVVDATPRTGGLSISLIFLLSGIVIVSSGVFASRELRFKNKLRWN